MDSREKTQQEKPKTYHSHPPKAGALIPLPGQLGLQAPDLLLALLDLRGEPSGHALGYNLQVPLPLELLLKVADPLLSVGALLVSQLSPHAELLYGLEQIIPLLP